MNFNNIDLNKLKCFQAVAEKGSLLDGAKALGLTTSAVYQSIKKLEADIQKHLFFRSGKRYILTTDGRLLQELFQRFQWDVSQFQDRARGEALALEGEIRVGLPLNFSKSVFIPVVKDFHALHPKVRFHLTIAETRRLLEQISAFEIDFAITDDSIPSEFLARISKREVFKEELALVSSKEFARLHADSLVSLKEMRELPHLDYSKDLPLIQRWYKLHFKRQVKIEEFHSIDNVETMVAALRSGLGLGIVPVGLLKNPAIAKDLQVIGTQGGASLHNPLYLVQEANYVNNTLLKKFLGFLDEKLGAKASEESG